MREEKNHSENFQMTKFSNLHDCDSPLFCAGYNKIVWESQLCLGTRKKESILTLKIPQN